MDRIQKAQEAYNANRGKLDRWLLTSQANLRRAQTHGTAAEMVEAIAECVRAVSAVSIAMHPALGAKTTLPGVSTLWYYMGYSDVLGKAKLGITKDVQRRAKSIRASMHSLGFPGDFELHDWMVGEEGEVRRMERRAFDQLAHLRRGGEWFAVEAEVFDWFFDAANFLEEDFRDRIADIDIEAQIAEAYRAQHVEDSIFGSFNIDRRQRDDPQTRRAAALLGLWRKWSKAFDALIELRNQQEAGNYDA